jgi:membrane-bound ClpP family serine protease
VRKFSTTRFLPKLSYVASALLALFDRIAIAGSGSPDVFRDVDPSGDLLAFLPIRPGAATVLLIGIGLLGLELFTAVPTFGVAGLIGALAIMLGGLYLFDPTRTELTVPPTLWIPFCGLLLAFTLYIAFQAGRALRSKDYPQGTDALIGEVAEVVERRDDHHAKISLRGEIWNAEWHAQAAAPTFPAFTKGKSVRVVGTRGFTALVVPT